ncbi:MAG: NUDIX domain-containing protein [Clostridia bacterium]|nr:NUDIX domain-containing protein [Clostridia bacterium]
MPFYDKLLILNCFSTLIFNRIESYSFINGVLARLTGSSMGKGNNMIFGKQLDNADYIERPSVYALIFNEEGEIALTYVRERDKYFLPGGGIEAGETHEQCVIRECLEEIGQRVRVLNHFCNTIVYEWNDRLKAYYKAIGDYYFAEILESFEDQMEDKHEMLWVQAQRATEVLVMENQAWAVKQAMKLRNLQIS